MRYAALASGSKGNCHAVSHGGCTLLIDAGISLSRIRTRLEACGLDAGTVRAVAITHEHSDHRSAVGVLVRNTDWAFIATKETKLAVEAAVDEAIPAHRWIEIHAGHPLAWEGWRVLPFSLPHDAADPVAFRVETPSASLAVVTDLGHGTALVADHCSDLDFLALEANHDIDMLRSGAYPDALKARILSRVGHLSNAAMAELLARVVSPRLQAVALAHLSEQNNHPDLARFAAEEVLRGTRTALHLASQDIPLSMDLAG